MLNEKANRLQVSCSKVRNTGIVNTPGSFVKFDEKDKRRAGALRDRSN